MLPDFQNHNHHPIVQKVHNRRGDADNIFFLIRNQDRPFIGKQIGQYRPRQPKTVDQAHIANGKTVFFQKNMHKRHDTESCGSYDKCKEAIRSAVQVHQGCNPGFVADSQRFIKIVCDGRSDPQLRHGEYGDNIGDNAVHAHQVFSHGHHHHTLAEKADYD